MTTESASASKCCVARGRISCGSPQPIRLPAFRCCRALLSMSTRLIYGVSNVHATSRYEKLSDQQLMSAINMLRRLEVSRSLATLSSSSAQNSSLVSLNVSRHFCAPCVGTADAADLFGLKLSFSLLGELPILRKDRRSLYPRL